MGSDIRPAGILRHNKRARSPVFIGIFQNVAGNVGVSRVMFARRVRNQPLQLSAPPFIAQGEESKENDRQNVALIIRRFYRTAKINCRLAITVRSARQCRSHPPRFAALTSLALPALAIFSRVAVPVLQKLIVHAYGFFIKKLSQSRQLSFCSPQTAPALAGGGLLPTPLVCSC